MKCPICDWHMADGKEIKGMGWFTGTWACGQHGLLRVSGMVDGLGCRKTLEWIPACRLHGFVPVLRVGRNRYRCTECGLEMVMVHDRVVEMRPAVTHDGRKVMAVL